MLVCGRKLHLELMMKNNLLVYSASNSCSSQGVTRLFSSSSVGPDKKSDPSSVCCDYQEAFRNRGCFGRVVAAASKLWRPIALCIWKPDDVSLEEANCLQSAVLEQISSSPCSLFSFLKSQWSYIKWQKLPLSSWFVFFLFKQKKQLSFGHTGKVVTI